MAQEAVTQEKACPGCGMRQADWRDNEGRGVEKGGELYCCQGCAGGSGCTCSRPAD